MGKKKNKIADIKAHLLRQKDKYTKLKENATHEADTNTANIKLKQVENGLAEVDAFQQANNGNNGGQQQPQGMQPQQQMPMGNPGIGQPQFARDGGDIPMYDNGGYNFYDPYGGYGGNTGRDWYGNQQGNAPYNPMAAYSKTDGPPTGYTSPENKYEWENYIMGSGKDFEKRGNNYYSQPIPPSTIAPQVTKEQAYPGYTAAMHPTDGNSISGDLMTPERLYPINEDDYGYMIAPEYRATDPFYDPTVYNKARYPGNSGSGELPMTQEKLKEINSSDVKEPLVAPRDHLDPEKGYVPLPEARFEEKEEKEDKKKKNDTLSNLAQLAGPAYSMALGLQKPDEFPLIENQYEGDILNALKPNYETSDPQIEALRDAKRRTIAGIPGFSGGSANQALLATSAAGLGYGDKMAQAIAATNSRNNQIKTQAGLRKAQALQQFYAQQASEKGQKRQYDKAGEAKREDLIRQGLGDFGEFAQREDIDAGTLRDREMQMEILKTQYPEQYADIMSRYKNLG